MPVPPSRLRAALVSVLLLSGCFSSGDGIELTPTGTPPQPAPEFSVTETEYGIQITGAPQGLAFNSTLNPNGQAGRQYRLLGQQPANGLITLDADSGAFTFTPTCWTLPGGCHGLTRYDFSYEVLQDGVATEQSATIHFISDPLFGQQWFLHNSGQNILGLGSGASDEDIDITTAYELGLTGRDIKVAVIDSGLELQHPDLRDNIVPGGSRNFADGSHDPTPGASPGDHGTAVAGLIAARGWNGLGGRGVAPRALLQGLSHPQLAFSEQDLTLALGGGDDPIAADAAIFNQSFGFQLDFDIPFGNLQTQHTASLLQQGVSTLRGGLGALYIKAAGNGFNDFETPDGSQACNSGTTARTLPCQNANMDPENALPQNLVVGATDASGQKASYSSSGSALLVSAPGGDELPLLTTDQAGCARGDHRGSPLFANDSTCDYTPFFVGTSAAAPVLSGVVALLLEANPALSWREVRHILLASADQLDTNRAPLGVTLGDGQYVAEPGWTTNQAGFRYHNWYGFGRVNAARAVQLARTGDYPVLRGPWQDSGWLDAGALSLTIPDFSVLGASHTQQVASNLIVEAVQVRVSATHAHSGDLGIELVSPSGTRSVLLTIRNGLADDADLADMLLLSNAFYGEPANGNWTLKVVDGDNRSDTKGGTLTRWQLRILGRPAP